MSSDVIIGYCHPADVKARFHHSLLAMIAYDSARTEDNDGNPREPQRILYPNLTDEASWARVPDARNRIVDQFLHSPATYLFMVDADMGFPPETVDRLLVHCSDDRPVIGGLCFVKRPVSISRAGAYHVQINPTMYHWHDDPPGFQPFQPDEVGASLQQVAATGAACLLIHRSVLEKVRDVYGPNWFTPVTHPDGERFSEDLSFCIRVNGVDKPIFVDSSLEIAHLDKGVDLDRWLWQQMPQPQHRLYAVIPAKDKVELTSALVDELAAQGNTNIIVVDNGSEDDATWEWIRSQDKAVVLDGKGMGIHGMWNLAVDYATSRSELCDIAFLNNDIEVGPEFMANLSEAIRATTDVMAASANYDGREGDRFQTVTGICAGRYDGTGGLAGFAFMVRGELFHQGYRFPTDCEWWYGDNDLVLSIISSGKRCVIARDATCVHLDGGSQTGEWTDPDMKARLEADREAFLAKWGAPQTA